MVTETNTMPAENIAKGKTTRLETYSACGLVLAAVLFGKDGSVSSEFAETLGQGVATGIVESGALQTGVTREEHSALVQSLDDLSTKVTQILETRFSDHDAQQWFARVEKKLDDIEQDRRDDRREDQRRMERLEDDVHGKALSP